MEFVSRLICEPHPIRAEPPLRSPAQVIFINDDTSISKLPAFLWLAGSHYVETRKQSFLESSSAVLSSSPFGRRSALATVPTAVDATQSAHEKVSTRKMGFPLQMIRDELVTAKLYPKQET